MKRLILVLIGILLTCMLTGCTVTVSQEGGQITAVASPNPSSSITLPTPNEDGTFPPMTVVISNPDSSTIVISTPAPGTSIPPTPTPTPTQVPIPSNIKEEIPVSEQYIAFKASKGYQSVEDIANAPRGSGAIACPKDKQEWLTTIFNKYSNIHKDFISIPANTYKTNLEKGVIVVVLLDASELPLVQSIIDSGFLSVIPIEE